MLIHGVWRMQRCGPIDRSSHQSVLGMANWPRAVWLIPIINRRFLQELSQGKLNGCQHWLNSEIRQWYFRVLMWNECQGYEIKRTNQVPREIRWIIKISVSLHQSSLYQLNTLIVGRELYWLLHVITGKSVCDVKKNWVSWHRRN